jgi:hypothetical protein
MAQPIEDFEMHVSPNVYLHYRTTDRPPTQLTLFNCCDIVGHAFYTENYSLYRENWFVADINRTLCYRCGHDLYGKIFNRLQYRINEPMTMREVRTMAQEYRAVTQSSHGSFVGLTAS